MKRIRHDRRWTAATVAAVVAVAAAVTFAAAGPLGGTRLTGAGSAAAAGGTGGSHSLANASAAAASSSSTLGSYTLSNLPYTLTRLGTGLHAPQGISVDKGVVYVSNTGANFVAEIKDGFASIVAGSPTGYGEHGDGGPATSATLFHPAGTAEDAKGDLFIADTGDNVIREVTPDGIIHRFAGTGTAGRRLSPGSATQTQLDHPQAVAVAPDGDVVIADTYNNRVLAVTPAGKVSVVAGDGKAGYTGDNGQAAGAELNRPGGVAVDAQGNVFIADTSNNVIREVNASTGVITTVAGNYAADKANDGLGGDSGDGGPATSAQLNGPEGISIDSAGNLFIADTFNNAIRGVTPAGVISTVAQVSTPAAVATDPSVTGVEFFVAGSAGIQTSGTPVPPVPYGTPVIDGQQDTIWNQSPVTTMTSNGPVGATVRMLWDDNYLYFLIEVSDATPAASATTTGEPGNAGIAQLDDAVDIWINWTNSPDASYTNTTGALASHYAITRNDVIGTNFPEGTEGSGNICPDGGPCGGGGIGDPSSVEYDVIATNAGYTVEAGIPWPAGVTPQAGDAVGVVTDVDDFAVPGGPRVDFANTESATQYWATPVGMPFVVLGPQQ